MMKKCVSLTDTLTGLKETNFLTEQVFIIKK